RRQHFLSHALPRTPTILFSSSLPQPVTLHPNRIQMQVSAQLQRPLGRIDQNRLEPSLKQVAAAPVPSIEPLTVTDVQPLHPPAQIPLRQLQQQVIVVGHQDVGVQVHLEELHHFSHQVEEMVPVLVMSIEH